jgi:hypothetical protein
MDKVWAVLDRLEGVDNGVNAAYYQVAGDQYEVPFHLLLVNCSIDILPDESQVCAVLQTLPAFPCMCTRPRH